VKSVRLAFVLGSLGICACAAGPAPASPASVALSPAPEAPTPPPPPPAAAQAPEDPSRATPPETSDGFVAHHDTPATFVLPNGMRVVVIERHGLPLVAARVIVRISSQKDDTDADLRATLTPSTFLVSPDTVGQVVSSCSVTNCSVFGRGAPNELGDILDREATMMRTEPPTAEGQRRMDAALEIRRGNEGLPFPSAAHATAALLFGSTPPFGVAPVAPKPPTLDALERWRRETFVPGAATLVLVGDVTPASAKDAAARAFGKWTGHGRFVHKSAPVEALPSGPRVAYIENTYYPSDIGAIAVRGPAWNDPDFAAALVATTMISSKLPEAVPCSDAQDRALTAWPLPMTPWQKGSFIRLGGYFAPKTAIGGLRDLLKGVRAAREAGPGDDELARAKRTAVMSFHRFDSDVVMLASLASDAIDGEGLDAALSLEEKVQAVTAADVKRVTQRFFAEESLRVVIVGKPNDFPDMPTLGLGRDAVVLDAAGRVKK
jgi:zinc protease